MALEWMLETEYLRTIMRYKKGLIERVFNLKEKSIHPFHTANHGEPGAYPMGFGAQDANPSRGTNQLTN